MDAQLQRALEVATLAVQAAARLTRVLQASLSDVTAIKKVDTSPVTIGDFAVQALLTSVLHAAFPKDKFLAEEAADALRQKASLRKQVFELVTSPNTAQLFDFDVDGKSAKDLLPKSEDVMLELIDMGGKNQRSDVGRTWIMDPIDGTATFMRGQQFVINCALLIDGVEQIGIIGCPNLAPDETRAHEDRIDKSGLGCIVYAVRGQGAFKRPVHSEPHNFLPAVKIERHGDNTTQEQLKWSDDSTATSTIIAKHRLVAARLKMEWPGTSLHSSVMKYAAMGLGLTNICIRIFKHRSYISNIWDHAGGVLIYEEAGGKVTDSAGKPIDFRTGRKMSGNFGLVCAPSSVHSVVLKTVQQVMEEDSSVPTAKRDR